MNYFMKYLVGKALLSSYLSSVFGPGERLWQIQYLQEYIWDRRLLVTIDYKHLNDNGLFVTHFIPSIESPWHAF